MLALAEYNGVFIESTITMKDGTEVTGFRYRAHFAESAETIDYFESNWEVLFANDMTYEPGEYSYYQHLLKYENNNYLVYKMVSPVALELANVAKVTVVNIISASYDIHINEPLSVTDKQWMDTPSITSYYYNTGEFCDSEVFIHAAGEVADEVLAQLKAITTKYTAKLKAVEESNKDHRVDDDEAEIFSAIYNEQKKEIETFLKQHKALKTITITMCSC
ncbi:hypothetical protein Y10_11230 [Neptunitalea sp. Y10]|uniref:Uncharacterized protein n=2 Tax=Neptunitalea lumnitzerae TaxID=2965509 RepID=A0ABQ5MI85_9FLAO|nr:hypothetical protein Y10_11230 [Neptunitalea sp. Y10]